MENKIMNAFIVFGLLFSISFAQMAGENAEETRFKNMNATMVQDRVQQRLQDLENSDNPMVRERKTETLRVHADEVTSALQSMEGTQYRNAEQIALKLNGSVMNMNKAEVKVQQRSELVKSLFGYNKAAITTMEQEMNQTRKHIQEMENLLGKIPDEAVRAMIQNQIQEMKGNLELVDATIVKEKQNKGWFGFLFGK